MNTISQKSYAKINLNLNVIGKTKNLHKLQSIVSLISLYDEISLREIDNRKHKILFKGKFSKKITNRNTIYKTLSIFRNLDYQIYIQRLRLYIHLLQFQRD